MNPELLASQLRDIRGLDAIPWWPLAPGWWLVAIGVVALVWLLGTRLPVWRWPRPTRRLAWQRTAARDLRALRRRVGHEDSKRLAGELSELLRRIAMARCGRDACAGLSGKDWLQWLSANDPLGFDWTRHGDLLTRLPYAPPAPGDKGTLLLTLIDAALAWTRPRATACPNPAAAEDPGAV